MIFLSLCLFYKHDYVLTRIGFSMAEDAVDAAIKSGKLSPTNECLTNNLRLSGAEEWDPASFTALAQQYVRMKRTYTGKVVPGVMDTAAAKHLSHAYGTMADRVAVIAQVCTYTMLDYIVVMVTKDLFPVF